MAIRARHIHGAAGFSSGCDAPAPCATAIGRPRDPWRVALTYNMAAPTFRSTQKSTTKYGNEHEAVAVYHMMKGVQKFCPIYTLAVGNAFGEAALLLSAGSPVSAMGGRLGLCMACMHAWCCKSPASSCRGSDSPCGCCHVCVSPANLVTMQPMAHVACVWARNAL